MFSLPTLLCLGAWAFGPAIASSSSHAADSNVDSADGFTTLPGFGNATVRYREVPAHICEGTPGVKSYAGYVDLSAHEHMFFWFFEARQRPEDAPLTAWISGGPGDASMAELFTEHGPCRVHPDGATIHANPFSWNNYSNVLYVDQPVHVGFSYTELVPGYVAEDGESIHRLQEGQSCPEDAQCGNFSNPDPSTTANSTRAAAPNFWQTLQSFMIAFPQYSGNGFHFGSESYGGHYVPVFSQYIADQNDRRLPGAVHIDLQSIVIGNGWFSPQLQLASYDTYGFDPGTPYDLAPVDDSLRKKVYQALHDDGGCLDQLKACEATGSDQICQAADHWCLTHVQAPFTDATHRDRNDVRERADAPFPNAFYADYLQRREVRQAIGAHQTYIELNPTVGIAFDATGDDARELAIIPILGDLLERGVRVTLYAGDADYECNWRGVAAVADAVRARGYDAAGYANITTADQVRHGHVRQSGAFSFVRVFEAGHAAGAFQPLLLQSIFARTIAGMDLATGTTPADAQYRTSGPPDSTYREGNGTVQSTTWPDRATYNYTSNLPTLEDFQPTWNGPALPLER